MLLCYFNNVLTVVLTIVLNTVSTIVLTLAFYYSFHKKTYNSGSSRPAAAYPSFPIFLFTNDEYLSFLIFFDENLS